MYNGLTLEENIKRFDSFLKAITQENLNSWLEENGILKPKKYGNIDSVLVATYLLTYSESKGILLNCTQIQKFLYITYGIYLSKYEESMFKESPNAWHFGPVFPKVHSKLNVSKNHEIRGRYQTNDKIFDSLDDTKHKSIIREVVDRLSNVHFSFMIEWSCKEGSPWYLTYHQVNKKKKKNTGAIHDNLIKIYFDGFLKKS